MQDDFLIKMSFDKLSSLILDANKRIYFAYPSLHPEVTAAFLIVFKFLII